MRSRNPRRFHFCGLSVGPTTSASQAQKTSSEGTEMVLDIIRTKVV